MCPQWSQCHQYPKPLVPLSVYLSVYLCIHVNLPIYVPQCPSVLGALSALVGLGAISTLGLQCLQLSIYICKSTYLCALVPQCALVPLVPQCALVLLVPQAFSACSYLFSRDHRNKMKSIEIHLNPKQYYEIHGNIMKSMEIQ